MLQVDPEKRPTCAELLAHKDIQRMMKYIPKGIKEIDINP
jgi:hypothetical protein